jgi:hypothetical protein
LTKKPLALISEKGLASKGLKDTLKGNVIHFLSFPKKNSDINVQICPVYFDGVEPFQFSEDEH